MKKINLDTWYRKEHYLFFKDMDIPWYTMSFHIDITPLFKLVKDQKLSFYFTMMFYVMKTVNQLDHFKYRIHDEDVYLHDEIHPSFTDVLDQKMGSFKIVNGKYLPKLDMFIKENKKLTDQQSFFINLKSEQRKDLVYITSFPWAVYQQASNPYVLDKKDTIPRISWGKFYSENDRVKIPLTIAVHHSFIDGFHVHKFLEKLSENIEKI